MKQLYTRLLNSLKLKFTTFKEGRGSRLLQQMKRFYTKSRLEQYKTYRPTYSNLKYFKERCYSQCSKYFYKIRSQPFFTDTQLLIVMWVILGKPLYLVYAVILVIRAVISYRLHWWARQYNLDTSFFIFHRHGQSFFSSTRQLQVLRFFVRTNNIYILNTVQICLFFLYLSWAIILVTPYFVLYVVVLLKQQPREALRIVRKYWLSLIIVLLLLTLIKYCCTSKYAVIGFIYLTRLFGLYRFWNSDDFKSMIPNILKHHSEPTMRLYICIVVYMEQYFLRVWGGRGLLWLDGKLIVD